MATHHLGPLTYFIEVGEVIKIKGKIHPRTGHEDPEKE